MVKIYKNEDARVSETVGSLVTACETYHADYSVEFISQYDSELSFGLTLPMALIDGVPLDEDRALRAISAIYGG